MKNTSHTQLLPYQTIWKDRFETEKKKLQEIFGNKVLEIEHIGYEPGLSSTERHFYTKGDPIEFHLSVAYADRGGFWPRQILFRDYLRTHSEARDEYAKLKEELLKKDPTGVGTYIGSKSEFVQKILKLVGLKDGQKYK